MTDILFLLISATLVSHFVLTHAPGLPPLLGKSGSTGTAIGMAAATTVVLTLASICTYLVYHYLLLPFDLLFLRTLVYIMIIAVVVSCTAWLLQLAAPASYRMPGIFQPLILTNCAVLGVSLINDNKANSFVQSVCYSLGASVGFSIMLILFSALHERLSFAEVPEPFRGSSIVLITAGLISLALMGFAGMV